MINVMLAELLITIVKAALAAYHKGDSGYLKRAAADATAWEVEQRAIDLARKRRK